MKKGDKIAVTIIIGSLRRGGAEIQLLEILPRLNSDKFNLEVLLLSTRGELANKFEEKGISVVDPCYDTKAEKLNILSRFIRFIIVLSQLFSYFLIKRPDVVHFFLPQSYCLGMPVAIISGIKLRLMSRLSLNNYRLQRSWMWQLEKILHMFATKIIVNSESIKRQLIDTENVPEEKISRIYSGISVNNSSTNKVDTRKKLGLDQNSLILIMVANLIPYKGHVDLIKALGLISEKMPNEWKMIFVGRDDGIKEELINETIEQGINKHCLFFHPDGDISDYYSAADIGILSSHEEGFSIAILEGMRSKLPMVVTNVGGNAEAVINNETGIVVPVRDCVAMSEAILELSTNSEIRNKMGEAACSRVNSSFTIDKCAREHEKLYESLV